MFHMMAVQLTILLNLRMCYCDYVNTFPLLKNNSSVIYKNKDKSEFAEMDLSNHVIGQYMK